MSTPKNPPNAARQAFSVQEAADALNISQPTLYKAIDSGELLTFNIGRRRLVSRKALDQYIATREASGTKKKDVSHMLAARHPQVSAA